jgi:tRNA threonylcarbamoyladenosine biosynthesis protein TsaB
MTLKTDEPEARLALYDDEQLLQREVWTAHRQLTETIHLKLADLLKAQQKEWSAIQGIVCYKGPGSFTGLRIGLSVGNATAYGVGASVVSETGEDWESKGIKRLLSGDNEVTAMPEYGAEVHITKARK